MITDFFLNLWISLTDFMIGFLPDSNPFIYGMGASWGMFGTMNYFLPMGEMLAVLVSVMLLGGPMLVASGAIWFIVGVLRGGATKA
jgi:hypothetical protein